MATSSPTEDLTAQLKRLRRGPALQDIRRIDDAPMLVRLALEMDGEGARDLAHRTRAAKRLLLEALDVLDEQALQVVQAALGLRHDARHRETGQRRSAVAGELGCDPRTVMRIEDAAFPTVAARILELHTEAVRARPPILDRPSVVPPGLHGLDAGVSPTAIGVLAPYSCWPTDYYRQIVEGIRLAANRERSDLQRSLVVLDVPPDDQPGELVTALQTGLLRDIAGLITINVSMIPALREIAATAAIPVVSVNHEEHESPFVCNVLHDHSAFAELMSRTLANRDVDAAVLVTKSLANPLKDMPVDPFRLEKRQIFVEQASAAGLEEQDTIDLTTTDRIVVRPRGCYVVEVDDYRPQMGSRLFDVMQRKRVKTLALVCLADAVALGFLASVGGCGALERHGVRLSGFDNSDLAILNGLTSVDYRLHAVGRLAYEQVQLAIDYPRTPPPVTQFVASEYCERASSSWGKHASAV